MPRGRAGRRIAASSVVPIVELSGLTASLRCTRLSRPLDERHSGSISQAEWRDAAHRFDPRDCTVSLPQLWCNRSAARAARARGDMSKLRHAPQARQERQARPRIADSIGEGTAGRSASRPLVSTSQILPSRIASGLEVRVATENSPIRFVPVTTAATPVAEEAASAAPLACIAGSLPHQTTGSASRLRKSGTGRQRSSSEAISRRRPGRRRRSVASAISASRRASGAPRQ